jgi:hypothetical protein
MEERIIPQLEWGVHFSSYIKSPKMEELKICIGDEFWRA